MHANRRVCLASVLVAATTAALGISLRTEAAVVTWTTAGGGSWNSGANWSTNPNLPTAADAATFDATIPNATNVITLDGNQTVYALNMVATTGAKIVQIDAGVAGSVLTLLSTDTSTDGATTFEAISGNSGILTMNAPIRLGDGSSSGGTATFKNNQNTSNSMFINGGVSEFAGQTWGIRVTGNGTANSIVTVQTTAMTYSGDTTIANNGVLRLLTAEMIPNGAGKGNVVIEGNGILRGQGNPGGFQNETINGLNSTSATAQVNLNQNNSRTLIVGDGNANGSYAGQITETTGTFAFTKIGSGTQSIAASNGSGVYSVNAGTLLVNGVHSPRLANANGYTVAAGATLGGTGTIGQSGAGASTGSVTVTGTLAPGNSAVGTGVGTLTINRNLILNPASTLAMQLAGGNTTVGGGVNDLVDQTVTLAGLNLTLAGTLDIIEIGPGSFLSAAAGDKWRLINYTGTLVSNTMTIEASPPALQSGLAFEISTAIAGQVNLLVVSTIPEPRAYLFGGVVCGVLGIAFVCRRLRAPALAAARARRAR